MAATARRPAGRPVTVEEPEPLQGYGDRYADPGSRRAQMLDQLDRYTGPPLLLLSVIFTVSVIIGFAPDLSDFWQDNLILVQWIIWAVFALDIMVKLAVAQQRVRYLRDNWVILLIVLLPFLRPLLILRGILAGVVAVRQGQRVAQRRGIDLALALAVVVVAACSVGVLVAEYQAPGANIRTFGDAIWWAMTTVTTVGYGDVYPVTPMGRGIAVLLMLAGITLFGFITASVAAFLVDTDREARVDRELQEILDHLRRLDKDEAEVRREIRGTGQQESS